MLAEHQPVFGNPYRFRRDDLIGERIFQDAVLVDAGFVQHLGEPTEVLELADVPEPSAPAAGEVLVGVEYAPINMNDLYVIQGAFPVRPSLPSIVGDEGVGLVLAIGGGVEHLKIGDGSSSRSMPSVGANG